jgi:methylglyoxal synthase
MQQFDIAFTAHDSRKEELVHLVRTYKEIMRDYSLVATRNTGRMIEHATGLQIARVHTGLLGGYQQIGALVAIGNVKVIIFLQDPFIIHPAASDIIALNRICNVHNIPMATNTTASEAVLHFFFEKKPSYHIDREMLTLTRDITEAYIQEICVP